MHGIWLVDLIPYIQPYSQCHYVRQPHLQSHQANGAGAQVSVAYQEALQGRRRRLRRLQSVLGENGSRQGGTHYRNPESARKPHGARIDMRSMKSNKASPLGGGFVATSSFRYTFIIPQKYFATLTPSAQEFLYASPQYVPAHQVLRRQQVCRPAESGAPCHLP